MGAFQGDQNGVLNAGERNCLKRCADQNVFFDTATYEFDSALEIAVAQGKPKRAAIFRNKRMDDLTTEYDSFKD